MNLKETTELLDTIPLEQAIMFSGIHGIGKSEFLKSYYTKKGYEVHIFFGATAADAGDIIGLPKHSTITVPEYDSNGNQIGTVEKDITSFSPPPWWPLDPSKKVTILLDEANRASADIQNCFMDMILNRSLNGRPLPPHTKVIAGINPFSEGYYEVNKTDPAFNDRFIIIDFNPSNEEWLYYGASQDYHPEVLQFIAKNPDMLDPNKESDEMVQPSRRSWERVSNYLKANPHISDGTFFNYLLSCVGVSATTRYRSFRKSMKNGLEVMNLLSKYDKDTEKKVEELKKSTQETCLFNFHLFLWFERNVEKWADEHDNITKVYFNNLYKYLEQIGKELTIQFIDKICTVMNEKDVPTYKGQNWGLVFQSRDIRFNEILKAALIGK